MAIRGEKILSLCFWIYCGLQLNVGARTVSVLTRFPLRFLYHDWQTTLGQYSQSGLLTVKGFAGL
jgi:hypothetical protein